MPFVQSRLIDIPNLTTIKTPKQRSSSDDSYIISICEKKSKEIGISILNLKLPIIQLCQFCDVQTYVYTLTELFIYQPTEIILPSTSTKSQLELFIRSQFPSINIVYVEKKHFSDSRGSSFLKEYVVYEDSNDIDLHLSSKILCLQSASALIHYTQTIQNITFLKNSLKVKYRGYDSSIIIDSRSIQSLELVSTMKFHGSIHGSMSLFDAINYTKTPQGARLLRSNLLQPPNDLATIKMRQDCVTEIIGSEKRYYAISKALESVSDIDGLISELVQLPNKKSKLRTKKAMIKHCQQTITNILHLKKNVNAIPSIVDALEGANNELLKIIYTNLSSQDVTNLANEISETLSDSAPSHSISKSSESNLIKHLFLVKPGVNGLLDTVRKIYSDRMDDIVKLADRYREDNEEIFQDLKILYNSKRGYFLSTNSTKETLPPFALHCERKGKKLHFTTDKLISLNQRIREAINEILLITENVVQTIQERIRKYLPCIYKLAESIAYLDMICSFASYVMLCDRETCCPELTEDGPIAINDGVHPILSAIKKNKGLVVANNTYASETQQNFHIITGENNSGKTTYLTQVATLTIMAHMGGYIPAHFGSFRLVDKIFTRIGSQDSIEMNASSFLMEMKEMAYIVNNAKSKSLIIIDELGRSTSYHDAVPICWAICEYLMSLKSFVFLSTHFHEMAKQLQDIYPMIKVHKLLTEKVRKEGNRVVLKFHYSLQEGLTDDNEYGINLAQQYGWPLDIITDARIIREKVLNRKIKKRNEIMNSSAYKNAEAQRVKRMIVDKILILKNSTLDNDGKITYINELKSRYSNLLKSLSEE